mgnify:FL=1
MEMRVNKYKILKPNKNNINGMDLNIPINHTPDIVAKSDIINTKFVDVELEKSINQILDYEKVKFLPKNIDTGSIISSLNYNLKFLNDSGDYNPTTYWSELTFDYDDFKFKKNKFVKSFLRLDFYDTDINSTQRLLFFITIFPKFTLNEYKQNGTVPEPNTYDVRFVLGNNLINREMNGEGFSLYYFKDEVIPTVPKEMFMRASFANAKTGKTTKFMSTNNPNLSVDELARTTSGTNLKNNLHTKYILSRDDDGYYYRIDNQYSDGNVQINTNEYTINLYEINAT